MTIDSSSKLWGRVAGVARSEPTDPRFAGGSLALDPGHLKLDDPNLELLTEFLWRKCSAVGAMAKVALPWRGLPACPRERRHGTRHGTWFFLPLALILLAGCSSSPEKTYPVQGVVRLDGKPLDGGSVLFESIEPGSSGRRYTARGTIDGQGNYRLSTFGRYDGAVAGRHRVVVLPDLSQMTDNPHAPPLPITVPVKYSALETTDLEYEVEPGDNRIDIELRSGDTSK